MKRCEGVSLSFEELVVELDPEIIKKSSKYTQFPLNMLFLPMKPQCMQESGKSFNND